MALDTKSSKGKDAPAVLMNIIRDIPKGADVKQREQEKSNFEKKYKQSDKRLDKLVQEHHANLTSIIQAFSGISTKITTSQQRIRAIKDNLQSCKNLLHCKRDELRKLWIEGIEHKIVVSMLDQIEQVKDVSDKLQTYIERKHYLHATDLLVSSLSVLEGDLAEVEALREIKNELFFKKEELFELLMDELNKQIYVKSTSGVVKGFQRQESLRQSGKNDKVSYLKLALKQSAHQGDSSTAGEDAVKRLTSASLEDITAPQQITEDTNLEDPECDQVYFISILVESLAMLRRMPEAIDTLRTRIKPGLLAIVMRASQQVADNACVEVEEMSQTYQPQLLMELLNLVFKQFRIVARVHEIVLANMKRVKNSMSTLGDFCLYDTEEVWLKIQSVLQQLLGDYLDIRHTAGSVASQNSSVTHFHEPASDVSSYFSRKRMAKQKKFPLFRFESSSHAISMNSYMREQRQEFYGSGDLLDTTASSAVPAGSSQFVCKPCYENITVIYNPLMRFLKEIESTTRAAPGSLTLQVFVREFIKDSYLGQVMNNIQTNIDNATKGFDAQRITIPLRTQREIDVPKPLLQSTVTVARSIENLCDLMRDLPDYADHFVNMICSLLQEYRETCHSSYTTIVKSDEEDKRIISATWAKDEDINRLLRSLPNWHSLQEVGMDEIEFSEDDQRAMNCKESSILTANLSSSEAHIPITEILSDPEQLRMLGNLCESLEWFSRKIKELAAKLKAGSQQYTLPSPDGQADRVVTVSENTLLTLDSLSKDFVDLAETCLLVLHLEVRVLCFFYLVPIARQSNYWGVIDDMDPDSNVIKLNKKLASAEEKMQQSLQARKFRYVFEGLGHLVSSILINSTQYLKRINENGIKKMCRNVFAIQQCLTTITSNRESDLDHARHYYELLYLTADEMLKMVMERGPQFSEHEYTCLLSLKQRSDRVARDDALPQHLERLREILHAVIV